MTVLDRLRAARVVPVVRTPTAALAATAVGWLREAGLTVFEITLTIPDAVPLIRELAADPALLVGAGTVPDAAAAHACLDAGAASSFLLGSIPPSPRRATKRAPPGCRGR